jgi:ADP-heptose:LPS heptosyltransferase
VSRNGILERARDLDTRQTLSRHILVVQLADRGDFLLAMPALEVLAAEPQVALSVLTKPSNRDLALKVTNDVIVADKHLFDARRSVFRPQAAVQLLRLLRELHRRRLDEAVILHHFPTTWGAVKFRLLAYATGARIRRGLDNGRGTFLNNGIKDRGFGAASETAHWDRLLGVRPSVAHSPTTQDWPPILREIGVNVPYIVVHPGSGEYSLARRWPVERFGAVIDAIHRTCGFPSIVVGGATESDLGAVAVKGREPYAFDICGQTSWTALEFILRNAVLFVGNDSGVAQLAASTGIPSLLIFGPTSPVTWAPDQPNVTTIHRSIVCSPCLYVDRSLGTPEGCETRECLLDLPAAVVASRALEMLESRAC